MNTIVLGFIYDLFFFLSDIPEGGRKTTDTLCSVDHFFYFVKTISVISWIFNIFIVDFSSNSIGRLS